MAAHEAADQRAMARYVSAMDQWNRYGERLYGKRKAEGSPSPLRRAT